MITEPVEPIEAPDFTSGRFRADPYSFYARLRADAPVHRVKLAFWLPVWLVTRYDDVLMVLRDKRFSKNFFTRIPCMPGPFYRVLVNLDPPDHTRLRALVSKAFTPRMIEQMRERIQGLCDELLDKGPVNGRMELVGDFALPLPLTIIADMMGIPPQDRSRFNSWSKGVMALTSGTVLGTLRALPGMWLLIRYFRKLIARRRADPRDDFVTALVQAEEGVTGLMKTNSSPCSSCSSGISWSRSCLAGALWRPPFSSKSVSASEMSSRV